VRRPSPALAAIWRARLAASGFDDHEDATGRLRVVGPQRGVNAVGEGNGHHARPSEYYDLLLAAMADPEFVRRWPPRKRRVIELHVEGKTFRQIEATLHCRRYYGSVRVVQEFRRQAGVTR
jgi:hypothetical protein